MQSREYRMPRALTVISDACAGVFMLIGLAFIIGFLQGHRAADAVFLAAGVLLVAFGAALGVEVTGARKLLVTDDGLHGFRNLHPMAIPWSSVRYFSVGHASARSFALVVRVTLDNGKRVSLGTTGGTRKRAERIEAELTEALLEYRRAQAASRAEVSPGRRRRLPPGCRSLGRRGGGRAR